MFPVLKNWHGECEQADHLYYTVYKTDGVGFHAGVAEIHIHEAAVNRAAEKYGEIEYIKIAGFCFLFSAVLCSFSGKVFCVLFSKKNNNSASIILFCPLVNNYDQFRTDRRDCIFILNR